MKIVSKGVSKYSQKPRCLIQLINFLSFLHGQENFNAKISRILISHIFVKVKTDMENIRQEFDKVSTLIEKWFQKYVIPRSVPLLAQQKWSRFMDNWRLVKSALETDSSLSGDKRLLLSLCDEGFDAVQGSLQEATKAQFQPNPNFHRMTYFLEAKMRMDKLFWQIKRI
jgi:hypothetical protein